jgi:glutamate 5-kinase
MRSKVTGAKRWVVKIGSALLTADGKGLDRGAMAVWVEQMVACVRRASSWCWSPPGRWLPA